MLLATFWDTVFQYFTSVPEQWNDFITNFPNGKVVSIPVGWWVNEDERQYIVDCIKKGW